MPLISSLDHLVIVCDALEQGVDYCERALGVRPLKGGRHPRMGTHNHLLNLGDGVYLEVIAIDPESVSPLQPRWFGMDARLAGEPRLTTFVARTSDIVVAADALPALGTVSDMSRDALHWNITIRGDGELLDGGAIPALIQWPEGVDPTSAMPDTGCRLVKLEVFHPEPDALLSSWHRIGLRVDHRLTVARCASNHSPYFVATIDTPTGIKRLSSNSRAITD